MYLIFAKLTLMIKGLSHLNGVVLYVEVTGRPAKVCGREITSPLVKTDHPRLIQLPAGLHH